MTSLGPRDPLGGRKSQISISTTFFHELNDSESFWTKKKFEKLVEKLLSLGASKHWKGSDIQKSQKKAPDFGFNHLFSRIGPFWVIWSNKNFFEIFSTDHSIWPFLADIGPRRFLYLLTQIFPGHEIFRDCS